jgi:hypothetical protein
MFQSILGNVNPRAALPFIDLLSNILILFPNEGVLVFENVFKSMLIQILEKKVNIFHLNSGTIGNSCKLFSIVQ